MNPDAHRTDRTDRTWAYRIAAAKTVVIDGEVVKTDGTLPPWRKVGPPTPRQVRMLLDAVMYRIDAEGRRHLMRELPEAYNAYCGHEYVTVMHADDGRPVRKP